MALVRYSTGSRKVAIAIRFDKDDGEPVTLVDPALDYDGTDLVKYEESYYDEAHLTIKDGEEPTWFHIKPLTHKQRAHIGGMSGYDQFLMAFRFGVMKVDNYYSEDFTSGERQQKPQVKRSNWSGMGDAVTEGWLKDADMITDVIISVGIMVMRISEAAAPLSRDSKQPSGGGE